MPFRKLIHRKPRKRVLIIQHAGRMRHDLACGWMKAGWDVFEAEGRADGLPLMFQFHPDLINLQVVTGHEDSWDALYSIRLLALTPVVVLTDGPPPTSDMIIENCRLIETCTPISASKIISISKAFWKSARNPSGPMTDPSRKDNIVPATMQRDPSVKGKEIVRCKRAARAGQ